MIEKFLIGSDPEFSCFNIKTNRHVSLVNYIEGTKDNKVKSFVEGCFHQLDNVGIEFDIPPQTEWGYLEVLIENCIKSTEEYLMSINKNFRISFDSSAFFPASHLKSKIAKTFGCEPSYNIYNESIYIPPEVSMLPNLRCFGFHLHFGFDHGISVNEVQDFIFICDLLMGIPFNINDQTNVNRVLSYGFLGDMRVDIKDINPFSKEEAAELTYKRIEYRSLGVGVWKKLDIIRSGIKNILPLLPHVKELRSLYFNQITEMVTTRVIDYEVLMQINKEINLFLKERI